MGCNQSTPIEKTPTSNGNSSTNNNESSSKVSSTKHKKKNNSINKRIESIDATVTATFGGLTLRYAYLSQRGYYPDDVHKPNQDSYVIKTKFGGRSSDAFFGVFDGHGRDGDKCAKFVRDVLPGLMEKAVAKAREREGRAASASEQVIKEVLELSKEQTQEAILKSHVECNRKIHNEEEFDDSLSGTTSISMYLHGNRNRITVNNVGDSRAVIGRTINSASSDVKEGAGNSILKAFALSRDQTPYRRDERIRIRKTGARILSLDQIEGLEPINEDDDDEENYLGKNGNNSNNPTLGNGELILGEEIDEGGDPPRVWSPHGDYPGTAFTRSIGDAIAEELGVYAEPEMLSRELTPEDKIIVLASDGVFEFLTNQSVIDICAKFSDPLEACRAVVAESYELWLQYELRTDDITMICIFVDGVDEERKSKMQLSSFSGDEASRPGSLKSLGGASVSVVIGADGEDVNEEEDDLVHAESRPVRKNISLEKSRALEKMKAKLNSIRDVTETPEEDFDIEKLFNEKTEDEKTRIAEAIRASVMFQNITDAQRELIYSVMEPMPVKKGDWIIKQGTVGDRFYIVDDGKFEVRILPEDQEDKDNTGGNVVHVYSGSTGSHSHPSFGELALMYSAPRAASIIAQTDGQLWALHRYAFKKVLAEKGARKDAEKILKKVDMFKSFASEELKDLASYLVESKYGKGDIIIREGDSGDALYIILPGGSCELVRTFKDGNFKTTKLSGNEFFGEEILKGGGEKKYLSTVTATVKTTCLTLQKADAKRFLFSKRKHESNMA